MAGIADGVTNSGRKTIDALKGLGSNAKEAVSATGTYFKEVATGVRTSGFIAGSAKLALKPVQWGMDIARMPVNIASASFKHYKVPTTIGAGLIAAVGVGRFLHKRAERQTKEALLQQAAYAQPMGNPYMNSVDPQTSAILNERMGGGGRSAGFADAVNASRMNGTSVNGPAV